MIPNNDGLPVITIVVSGFPPAHLLGGPVRSVAALVSRLGDEFGFRVVTSAYDLGCSTSLEGVATDTWTRRGSADVFYSTAGLRNVVGFLRLIERSTSKVVALNSLFSPQFGLAPLFYLAVKRRDVALVVAPRGELSEAALSYHRWRKRLAIAAIRVTLIHRRIAWQVSSEAEMNEVERQFRSGVEVHVARDLTERLTDEVEASSLSGASHPGMTSIGFLSRISPKKNLDGLLRALKLLDRPVHLAIAGPPEDREHWQQCEELMADLPGDVTVEHLGPLSPDQVMAFLGSIDVFALPTHGENFAHVVAEALLAGRPVVVGSETPWASIEEQGAGFLCDSRSPSDIADKLRRIIDATPTQREDMSRRAHLLGTAVLHDNTAVDANRNLLTTLLERSTTTG